MRPGESGTESAPSSEMTPSGSSIDNIRKSSKSHESSIFEATACGEPLCVQRLMVDFSPIEESDTDFVQRKCRAFWDYLKTRTDLNYLMVLPEKNQPDLNPISGLEPSPHPEKKEDQRPLKETTAVSMLKFVEEKVSKCSEGCKICSNRFVASTLPEASPDVHLMCRKLQEWDSNHPKSMDPPGHPPSLSS